MQIQRFALVAYVRLPAGQFVENLRQQLHPESPAATAHLTILPPRILAGSEARALEQVEEVCSQFEPFRVTLDGVETFIPVTPTLYIRVGEGAARLRELHDLLNRADLRCQEQWPYMPHMTIVKMENEAMARRAHLSAREGWAQFKGSRTFTLTELTFVREEEENCWVDLAGIPLGRSVVKS